MQKILTDKKINVLLSDTTDLCYVDNVVWAHLLAERALRDCEEGVNGEAFIIANERPISSEEMFHVLQQCEPSLKIVHVPMSVISCIAKMSECMQRCCRCL